MKGGILFVSYNLWCVNNTKEITDFPQKVSFLLVLTSTVIHSDIDGIASAWRCVSYICALLKRFSSHSLFSWLDSFFFLPALFFATAILNLNFLPRLLMTSTFFSWAEWDWSFCLFILQFRICFQENDDEVDGRSSSVCFWLSQTFSTNISLFVLLLFSRIHRACLGLP